MKPAKTKRLALLLQSGQKPSAGEKSGQSGKNMISGKEKSEDERND